LLKCGKLCFGEISRSTFRDYTLLAVYAEAKEKGWMDDYRKWLATAKK